MLELAKEEGMQKSDIAAAAVPPREEAAPAIMGAPVTSDDKHATSATAPASAATPKVGHRLRAA